MITKLESNVIKSMLNENINSRLVAVAADRTTMKIGADVDRLLDYFLIQYKLEAKNPKIGKSTYLWKLLKKFRDDQMALMRYAEVDPKLFDKSMLTALQTFKRLMKDYVDKAISSQSEAVMAILMYSAVRRYETDNDFKIHDYLDDEYEDDMLELKGYPVRIKRSIPALEIEELFEEPVLEQNKYIEVTTNTWSDK